MGQVAPQSAGDLTQEELAQQVPRAVTTLQKIEANERRPSKQMAERLAMRLGIPVDERPAFVRFARMEPGAQRLMVRSQAGQLISWRPWSLPSTNLPLQPAPLIGRDRDVAAVRERLLGDGARLLTLVGPPGVGKTRLAIETATSLLDDFGDGVYFVALAPVGDPDQVAMAVAQALGVDQTAEQPFASRLKEYLRGKHMLLVLDNFEQVVTAAPLVSELLAECPWLSILVTSRAPLRVRPERQFAVLPLKVPTLVGAAADPAELMSYSAIALFVERSRSVRPDSALTPANARAIAAICARLDGLPLAIELVAARIAVLPPQALLERLDRWLMLHTDGLRDAAERHRTLYGAIDWSYALLGRDEHRLLARLGVFVDGWTLEAAESVALDRMDHPSRTALDALTALVNNSLVVRQKQGGEPRFTLLETIRAYALERLAESGQEEMVRQRHAEYCLAFAEKAAPHLRTAAQSSWLDQLEAERGNMRAALSWFLERAADPESGLRLVGALGWFWIVRGHVSEGRNAFTRALQQGCHARPALRARVLTFAGAIAWPADLPAARSLLQEGIALYRELGPSQPPGLAHALTALALVMAYEADHDAVRSASEEALALSQQAQDPWGVALARAVLGEAHLLRYDYAGACSQFAESLALFREIGDKWGIGTPLMNWGYTDSLQGNLDAARARLEESITVHGEVGERVSRSLALNILAQVVQQQGDHERAAALYGESLDLLQKMGLETSIADVLHNLAHVVRSQGHYPLAAKLYRESLSLFAKQGNGDGVARCRAGLAAVTGTPEGSESGA